MRRNGTLYGDDLKNKLRQPTQLPVTMKNSSDRELIFKFNLRADLDGINLLYADKTF